MVKIFGSYIHVISRCFIKGLHCTKTCLFAIFYVSKKEIKGMTNSLFYNLTCVSFEHPTNSSTFPVPEPYIREPTDFIPDSKDTSATTSREVTQANISQNNGTAEETKTQQQPKVVSLVCRAHEGQLSAAPYSIKPTQLVSLKYLIPGHVALSVKCLATDESLIADPGSRVRSRPGPILLVGFVALRPKSTAMVIAGRSVHLTTLFPGQA